MIVPTTPATVTTRGSATVAMQKAAVDDVHAIVAHAASPRRPEGVWSLNTKFRPTTDSVLVVTEAAMFSTMPRALTAGAGDEETSEFPLLRAQRGAKKVAKETVEGEAGGGGGDQARGSDHSGKIRRRARVALEAHQARAREPRRRVARAKRDLRRRRGVH